jgi:GT2 family glycosyltransferase
MKYQIKNDNSQSFDPSITVIIATKDRHAPFLQALGSCLSQKRYPEQIVVIDQSKNKLNYKEINFRCKKLNIDLKIIYDPEIEGLPEARNVGIKMAEGDILCFIDDDCVLERDYFENIINIFKQHPGIVGVGGFLFDKEQLNRSRFYKFFFRIFSLGPFYDEAQIFYWEPKKIQETRFLHGASMSFKKKVFDKHLFSTCYRGYAMGEEREFCLRVSHEFKLILSSDIHCIHNKSPLNRYKAFRYYRARVISEAFIFRKIIRKGILNKFYFIWYCVGIILSACYRQSIYGMIGAVSGFILIIFSSFKGNIEKIVRTM